MAANKGFFPNVMHGDKWKITTTELAVKAVVLGIDKTRFEEIARLAEASCPISNALRNNVEIKLNAALAQ